MTVAISTCELCESPLQDTFRDKGRVWYRCTTCGSRQQYPATLCGSITRQGCKTPEPCNAGAGEVDGACQLCDGEEWLAVLTPREPETHLCPRCFHSRELPGSQCISKEVAWETYKKRIKTTGC